MKNFFSYILFLLFFASGFAQQKRITASIDSAKVKIGAQINLTLKTSVDTLSNVVFPESTNFGALEVLEIYPTDTVKENDRYLLTKKYGLTQFDSGKYTIPTLYVLINDKRFETDSLKVEIMPVKVDTLKQKMYDIKGISKVESPSGKWWIYVLAIVILAAIGYAIYYFAKKYKRKEKPEEIIFATPIEKAVTLLKSLENKQLWQKGEVKNYYSELTDIARTYIEEEIEIPAMESTTSEVIAGLRNAVIRKKMNLTQETVENLERVLRQADLVKFAKVKPLDFEIAEDRNKIEKTIFTLHKAIPEVEEIDEEALLDAKKHEQLLKQKRKRKRAIIIASGVFVIFIGLGIWLSTSGMDYLRENVFGYETKQLAEGEWIKSDYGNPAISVETPKVLKRQKEVNKTVGVNSQTFSFGSPEENLSIRLTSATFSKESQIENLLSLLVDAIPQDFEKKLKATDILFKNSEFEKDGIKGVKSYGSMRLKPDGDEAKEFKYEVYTVVADGIGSSQITVIYDATDKYAPEIAERIINSVELKKAL